MLDQLLKGLNTAIATVAQLPNVALGRNYCGYFATHLPNPQNIHLEPEGYQVVAKQFWNKVQAEYPWIPVDAFAADDVTTDSVTLQWKPAAAEAKSQRMIFI